LEVPCLVEEHLSQEKIVLRTSYTELRIPPFAPLAPFLSLFLIFKKYTAQGVSMKKFVLSLVSLLMLMISLNASSPAKAFGSYLSGAIKDADYDSKNFPDRLLRVDNRKIMLATEPSTHSRFGFDIIPLKGKFLTRHIISTRSYEKVYEQKSIHYSRITEYDSKSISTANYCAFKVGGIPVGFAIGASKSEYKQDELELTSPLNSIYGVMEKDRDSNNNGLGFTVSTSFYANSPTSIAFNYTESSSERDENLDETRLFSENYVNKDKITSELIDHEAESMVYGVKFLHDFGLSQQYRLTGGVNFVSIKRDEFESERDTLLDDDEIESFQIVDYSSLKDSEEIDGYSAEMGISKTIKRKKFKFYVAISSKLTYYDTSKNKVNITHYQNFANDSLYVEETLTIDNLDEESYYLYLENPLGMSYDVADWFTLYASINNNFRFNKKIAQDDEGIKLEGWSNKVGQRICFEFRPIMNLEVGIYSISDLKDYKDWKLDISYFF